MAMARTGYASPVPLLRYRLGVCSIRCASRGPGPGRQPSKDQNCIAVFFGSPRWQSPLEAERFFTKNAQSFAVKPFHILTKWEFWAWDGLGGGGGNNRAKLEHTKLARGSGGPG